MSSGDSPSYEPEYQGTGAPSDREGHKIISYPFAQYTIRVELTATNEFVAVVEVIINSDFLSQSQRLAALSRLGYHDVDQYYQTTEEE